jgi:hypothetical protein
MCSFILVSRSKGEHRLRMYDSNKLFSGYLSCHNPDVGVDMIAETSVIFTQLTRLTEDAS